MAEAVVDGTSMSRFFCHKCSVEIERLLPNFTCPNCASGFIEELEGGNDNGSGMDVSNEDLSDIDVDVSGYNVSRSSDPERDLTEMLLVGLPFFGDAASQGTANNRGNTSGGRRIVHWSSRDSSESRRAGSNRGRDRVVPTPIENLIQEFILNLSGVGMGLPMAQGGQSPVLFLGNPGDYVWGRDGLDAIVTQLLNQMDGTGPPPLPKKQIDEIPTTAVSQSQVDSKLQCSVCWEDFHLAELVRQLPCQHLYHAPCIVPWLELHGTCPICRQSLGDQSLQETNHDAVGASLAALFSIFPHRAANETTNSRPPSTASTSTGSSNTGNNPNNI